MWPIIGFGVFAVLVAVKEIPGLRKQGLKRELWTFLLLLLLGTGFNIAHVLRIPLKNPVEWIYKLYHPVSDFFFHHLQ